MRQKSRLLFLLFFSFVTIIGCTTYSLTDNELKWNPYQEGDILIFADSLNNYDTVFITTIERRLNNNDQLSFISDKNETLVVQARYNDPSNKEKTKYIEDNFLEISKGNNVGYVFFNLKMRKAKFYNGLFKINLLEKVKTENITIADKAYSSVIGIRSNNEEYTYRENFVRSFYWSQEYGYVKIDLQNGYWYLVKRIREHT